MNTTEMTGTFLSFEGVDGGGKSTQARRFAAAMQAAGYEIVLTREPGGSPGAEEIRRLIIEGDAGRWSPETELLLFNAARRDHLEKLVIPSLQAGKFVISDRFADSSRVYQGATRGDLRALVDRLHDLVIGHEPHLTIIIDVDPVVALERTRSRMVGDEVAAAEDRFESMGLEFQEKLRAGYRGIAAEHAARCALIDGHGTEDDVFVRLKAVIKERLQIDLD